ncbi:MAG: polyamine aminopropyltransferase, partial [Bacteroidia bacterium]|nr:polyamine aminopropyltransferase [Bacteroidia bacterium]MDW8332626.1 polyamine aminopropyltransferase [Bacteroidia bacterium]
YYGCPPEALNDVGHIEQTMLGAAKVAGATVINSTFHHFSPFGVSGVVVIQESHLAIHTWPEYGYASVDVFTCGSQVNPWDCYRHLHDGLKAKHGSAIEMSRGVLELLPKLAERADYETQRDRPHEPPVFRNVWFTERGQDVALSLRHTGEILYKRQSAYQRVEILNTYAYGKMMTLDGMVMTTEKDEYVYHEMIAHVPMLSHPHPRRVLVVGGGDGGTVREIVRHPELEKVVMVEIDALVVEAARLHLPSIASAFDHPKLELRIEDGIEYVKRCDDETFDVVIVDSTDPVGPAEGLFTEEFYRDVYRILKNPGVMVTQSESPRFNVGVFQEIYALYRRIFGFDRVHCYLISVPTYPSGTWSLAYCAKGEVSPKADPQRRAAFLSACPTRYYNAEIHDAAFVLPNFVRHLLNTH